MLYCLSVCPSLVSLVSLSLSLSHTHTNTHTQCMVPCTCMYSPSLPPSLPPAGEEALRGGGQSGRADRSRGVCPGGVQQHTQEQDGPGHLQVGGHADTTVGNMSNFRTLAPYMYVHVELWSPWGGGGALARDYGDSHLLLLLCRQVCAGAPVPDLPHHQAAGGQRPAGGRRGQRPAVPHQAGHSHGRLRGLPGEGGAMMAAAHCCSLVGGHGMC